MIRILFASCLMIILPLLLQGASVGDKVSGYVVLDNGKKLEGKIVIGTLIQNEIYVSFISKGRNTRKTYYPRDLQAYAYQVNDIDDMGLKTKIWVEYQRQKVDQPPQPFGSTLVFMQVVERGTISLYSYFIETPNEQELSYRYIYYLELEDGLLKRVHNDSFERVTRNIFKDYTALTSKIGGDQFLYRDLDQMVRDFNYWMVNKHDKNEYRMAMKLEKDENKEIIEDEKF